MKEKIAINTAHAFRRQLSNGSQVFESLVNQPVLPADCQSQKQLCLQGGGGPQATCKNEDVALETGFRGNFEDVGRAFVQAYKEGWRLTKEERPENETHQVESAGVINHEHCLEDFSWDEEGSCTDSDYRSPCERQEGDDAQDKGTKTRSKRSRGGRRRKNRSKRKCDSWESLLSSPVCNREGGNESSEKEPADVLGGEQYQINEGGYGDRFCDHGASGGENYPTNEGGYEETISHKPDERLCSREVGVRSLGINSLSCTPPVGPSAVPLIGLKVQSHNMFARLGSEGTCSVISSKLVTDLGFWSWVQPNCKVFDCTDGQAKRGAGVIVLEVELPNSPFKTYHQFEVMDMDDYWGNICVLGADFLNQYGVNLSFHDGGAQIFSEYWGIYEPVMTSFESVVFCKYYMVGRCRFGRNCWFHHPQYSYHGGWGDFEQSVYPHARDTQWGADYNGTYHYRGQNSHVQTLYQQVGGSQWGSNGSGKWGPDSTCDEEYDNFWPYVDPFGQLEL